MSHKSPSIAARIAPFQNQDLPAHYLGFIDCFNSGSYYEAHDVLEDLWLGCRRQPMDGFYKGLIQLAGAFVHVTKNRPGPAVALLKLSSSYLVRYPSPCERLSIPEVLALAGHWIQLIESHPHPDTQALLQQHPPPLLQLEARD